MLCKVLEYKKFTIITLSNAGKAGIGRGGSKKFKLIPKLPRGAGLEFIPIATPSALLRVIIVNFLYSKILLFK